LVIAFVVLAASAPSKQAFEKLSQTQFEAYKIKFAKKYKSVDEEAMRLKIFRQNLKRVAKMNMNTKGRNNFGITQFSDLTPSEFSHLYLMPHRPLPEIKPEQVLQFNKTAVNAPASWDWRTNGLRNGVSAITAVYNQGQCGSCWAFSATEQTESMEFLQNTQLAQPHHLSMQQVVDCDTQAYGCDGGWTYVAYEYIMSAGGYDSLSSYPYTAVDGSCAFNPSNVEATISNWKYITQNQDEETMKSYVGSTGPISICVDASSWQFYNGGVLSSCGTSIDHCVHLVGYGTVQGTAAWIVRNSWGTSWGVSGYIYLEYGQDTCALAQVATTVTAGV
jgi:C1A family cysteine protease